MRWPPACKTQICTLLICLALGGVSTAMYRVWVAHRQPHLLILAGTLLDGHGGPPQTNMAIEVRNGMIKAVRPLTKRDIARRNRPDVTDLREAVVLPGLIDAHVHIRPEYNRIWLTSGVTTIADLCTNPTAIPALRSAAARDNAPRLLVSGPMINLPGGYPAPMLGAATLYPVTEENAGARVTSLIDNYNVDVVKIALSSRRPEWPLLSAAQVATIVAAAHSRGRPVLAHVEFAEDFRRAVAGGVDVIAHAPMEYIPDALLQQAVDQHVILIPTLQVMQGATLANTRRFNGMGGKIAFGDDAGYIAVTAGYLQQEFSLLRQAGLSTSAVIQAATWHAAQALGISNKTGTIAPGMQADLLAVTGNPLQDLKHLQNVVLVVKAGHIVYAKLGGTRTPSTSACCANASCTCTSQ